MASCKSASKLYQKGNYDEAVQVAVKKLQKDPNDAKLKTVVQDAYHYAVTDHENRIRNYSSMDNELKWEWMYNEYSDLQSLYNAIFKSPTVFELVHPTDYSSDLNNNAAKASDVHYNRGMQFMRNNERQSFKDAYHEFRTAMNFKPGDLNIQQKMDEAYKAALTVVAIVPVNNYGFQFSSYNYQLQNFDNDIVRNLQYNTGNEFVKFYSTWDIQRLNIIPDEIVEMHFTQFNIGGIRDNYSTKEISKDVVTKEIVYKADSVIKQYTKVKATITTTQRTMYSEGNLRINIRDNNGKWLYSDNVVGHSSWSTEFSSYTGDERALSDDDKKLVTRLKDDPPHEEEIIKCIQEGIYSDFIYKIRNYYSRY
jgi:tetratricopeptide (TPR) repeat protein